MIPDALDQYRQPEYTGENRCLPCTAVNVGIAVVLSAFASFIGTPVLGLLVFGGSLLSIYLRGYLMLGTPELTKEYLPDWVLAKFDKTARPPESEPDLLADSSAEDGATATSQTADDEFGEADHEQPADPETLLFQMDAVQETADREDIELTDAFADTLLGVDDVDATIESEIHGPAFYAGEERLHRWPSEAALLADASAHRALAGRGQWEPTAPEQRLGIARALRSFLSTCPVCGGAVGLTKETVSSCCRAWDVFAVRCEECEAHFLELEPRDIDDGAGELVEESEGARGVSGGFVR